MFLLNKPTDDRIREIIERHRNSPFSYSETGTTNSENLSNVPGYDCDNNRILLGHGEVVFQRAIRAIRNWKMFDFPWSHLRLPNAPIEKGTIVAAVFKHFGFWSVNLSRIVYVIDEKGDQDRFGFAYGTLGEHVEQGEERFSVEWNHQDNSVWYDILAFSKPRNILARIGYPISRRLQRRFVQESKESMVRATNTAD